MTVYSDNNDNNDNNKSNDKNDHEHTHVYIVMMHTGNPHFTIDFIQGDERAWAPVECQPLGGILMK